MIAGTICGSILFTGIAVAVLKLLNPEENTDTIVNQISDVINTLIGLLAGFLAGRTDYSVQKEQNETDTGIQSSGTPSNGSLD